MTGPRLRQHCLEKCLGDLAFQQAVPVLGEHRHVPYRIVHFQVHEPTEKQVVMQLLHQLPLGADREEHLQQQRPQQPFRRNRVPPARRIEFVEQRAHCAQRLIHHLAHRAQRMIRGNPILQGNIAEHRRLLGILAAHRSSSMESSLKWGCIRYTRLSPNFRSLLLGQSGLECAQRAQIGLGFYSAGAKFRILTKL